MSRTLAGEDRETGGRGGKVRMEVVQKVSGETLVAMAINKVKRGSFIYTDKFRRYYGHIAYGFRHLKIDHGNRFVTGKGMHQRN